MRPCRGFSVFIYWGIEHFEMKKRRNICSAKKKTKKKVLFQQQKTKQTSAVLVKVDFSLWARPIVLADVAGPEPAPSSV